MIAPGPETRCPEAFFNARVQELQALSAAQALSHWDMQTYLPPGAHATRADTLSALGALAHERLADPAFGDAIAAVEAGTDDKGPDESARRRALAAEMAYRRNRAVRLPTEWVRRFEDAAARGYAAWAQARENNDFAGFRPTLETLTTLARERADALKDADGGLYDALLEDYERGATVAKLDPVFDALRRELTPLVAEIVARQTPEPDCFAGQTFPKAAQNDFCRDVLAAMGYDFARGRMDASLHPFTTEIGGRCDVRLTIRATTAHPLESLFTALHEGGHALYEQGVAESLDGSPLGTDVSLGIHESQSRLWENLVGRGAPFWRYWFPRLQAAFPAALQGVSEAAIVQRVNRVTPSLIRTEADEATYNLHILLRYEIEKALVTGKMSVSEIPDAWNTRMRELLGVDVPDDARGCLQDVHWSGGSFGYFPTYTLGNLYAAQFYAAALRQTPDLEARIAAGDLLTLRHWLREQIHVYGKTRTAQELAIAVSGEPLNPQHFLDALRRKHLPDVA